MLDVLEKLMKQYKKNLQKAKVRVIGQSGILSRDLKKAKVIRLGEEESKFAQKSISTATKGLQETVEGQFSKKVTEVFDKQKQTLDNF